MGQFGSQILWGLLILLFVVSVFSAVNDQIKKNPIISISELAQKINADQVTLIEVRGEALTVTGTDKKVWSVKKETESSLSQSLINYGVKPENLSKVKIDIQRDASTSFWLTTLLPLLIPILFIIFIFWYLSRQVKGASMQAFSFGQSKARIVFPDDNGPKVTFKDVAGVREAKEELLEIVDFLKNPKKFLDIGARIPKGVLLMGAPGTGKTLLARAVAGEAKVPFLYLSGSEFVEMFVGVGASRVRDLFKLAKDSAPAIIFIDEIDAIGRHRGSGMGGGNDEREQTLNQILVEMDGFEPNEKLIVMAATNRPDVLDPALLRPGRFDRRVMLDSPDKRDREEILLIHARHKPMGPDVNMKVIAERTPGFSGADLANAVNEAAILTAREVRTEVSQYDLLRSIEKVMLGPERRSHILSAKEKRITAYHEIGHALAASVLEYSDPVHKVSIISRGRAAGYTLKLPFEDRKLQSRKEFLDDLAVSLGGYVAEQMIFDDITTGASNDIAVSTDLARAMVTKYGMSDKLGPVAIETSSHLSFSGGLNESAVSEKTSAIVDEEVSRLMNDAMVRVKEILTNYRAVMDSMSEELIRTETLEREEFERLLILNGIKPKRGEEMDGLNITPIA
ncbi:MAG: cell division protein FtsH [Candidatus Vogelbacteria bacterium RIFOXYD2_FULL_44_9]|uniref:ATP-dependent zinc metalloprotease FtsH n=1 Tax=Candidatus Vogelbacteria bacterium RIFOXYD2_FULL_44_9 TaxID=1802441 RepID=A0A1G2QQ62_9BACT|nr:MAG: cell division protein FtsH [Candidatus Vogelbacteria bacterium RIFOXYD2_FULL_44_9]